MVLNILVLVGLEFVLILANFALIDFVVSGNHPWLKHVHSLGMVAFIAVFADFCIIGLFGLVPAIPIYILTIRYAR